MFAHFFPRSRGSYEYAKISLPMNKERKRDERSLKYVHMFDVPDKPDLKRKYVFIQILFKYNLRSIGKINN